MNVLDDRRSVVDPMEDVPIRCTVEMTGDGTLTLIRSAGCTSADARDLCALVARGDEVVDLTR